MIIKLNPIVKHEPTTPPTIRLNGLILTIGDTDYDLSAIPEGGQAEGESPFVGICTRDEVTIEYPYSTDIYEPNQPTEQSAYEFDIVDGQVPCPLIKRPVVEEVTENV